MLSQDKIYGDDIAKYCLSRSKGFSEQCSCTIYNYLQKNFAGNSVDKNTQLVKAATLLCDWKDIALLSFIQQIYSPNYTTVMWYIMEKIGDRGNRFGLIYLNHMESEIRKISFGNDLSLRDNCLDDIDRARNTLKKRLDALEII